jgi:2-hydroxy-6-oxo-6-(2'-aminophenyl)hexa-2,4-dienoate hydrolase
MATVKFGLIPPGVEEKELTVNGITSTYWEIGEGEPLVLTHGGGPGGAGIVNWYSVMPLFAEAGFRAIAVNMLGYGLADYPEQGPNTYPEKGFRYDVDSRIRHLIAQLDALDIERACLIGNSMGGTSSLGVCARVPERVRRLVLMGSGGLPTPRGNKLEAAATRYQPTYESMVDVVNMMNNGFVLQDMEEIVRYRFEVSMDENNTMARDATMAIAKENADAIHLLDEEVIRSIKTETLIVQGRDDTIFPPHTGLRFHELLENSWLSSFPKCGHWAMLQYPEAFAELCSWFLKSKTLTNSRVKD